MTERLQNEKGRVVDVLLWSVGVPLPLVCLVYMLFH